MEKATVSLDVLERFITEQSFEGDACSARLLETKRALDGLLKDLKALSLQVDSHEEVLETETENLNITQLSVLAVEKTHGEGVEDCDREKQDALDRVSQYQSELDELTQIAKPSVRYNHVINAGNVSNDSLSLIQQDVWTRDACIAFLEFEKKKKDDPKETKKSCDAQRKELQEAFTEAVIKTRDLLKQAQADAKDTTCLELVDAKRASSLVPLVSERERASSVIDSSSEAIAALDPVLSLLKSRVEKLTDHIDSVLTPECSEAKAVSEALQKIRQLILELEKCPGRNNFKLEIPEEPTAEPEWLDLTSFKSSVRLHDVCLLEGPHQSCCKHGCGW